ncbi:uncharacterized protein LOC118316860 isoform X5 [Scophthalmus maximus]|uniref:uncharacterized protein LOC118316860 isoform X5 n=1 Tax=Scophthalmus maximus TaxID=52904 RepID=UPI0015E09B38|nr:uncharacterized protein LOC118316860 isoform X5 [Scophthalmus maximus]
MRGFTPLFLLDSWGKWPERQCEGSGRFPHCRVKTQLEKWQHQDIRRRGRKRRRMELMMWTGTEIRALGSRRSSEVGEELSLEPTTEAASQKRRKKKKTATIDLEDDQADLVNGDAADQTTDGEEVIKKPKRKKKSKLIESQLPDELDVEEDDIITDTPPPIAQHSLFSAPKGQSQPVGKVFVERNKRFQAAERSEWRKTSGQMDNMTDFQHMQPLWTTRDVSIRVHKGYSLSSLLCLLQEVWFLLSRLPGRLRRVERGGGVHVGRAAPHCSVQPAGAVPQPGVPLPVSALHAPGHQHCGRLRQVESGQRLHGSAGAHHTGPCCSRLVLGFLSTCPLFEPADDQRSHQPIPIPQHNVMATGFGAPDPPPMGDGQPGGGAVCWPGLALTCHPT